MAGRSSPRIEISVWAPDARRVDLVLPSVQGLQASTQPLEAQEGGWFEHPGLPGGADYFFRLDGGNAFPDPRSAWQANGVHGPSRVVDHSAFKWLDVGFEAPALGDGLIYELHIGTFSEAGTFEGAIAHLDHLVALGVTHVEVMPIAEFPGRWGWGYDGVSLFAPHNRYGGPRGFKLFVQACHQRGLAVILDVVYNHLGPRGNYLGQFGPYFTQAYRTPWGPALNFDGPNSDEVRRFFCDNALMWLRDYHVDGLRLDSAHSLFDRTAVHVLEQIGEAVSALSEELGRPLHLIAETDSNDSRYVRSPDKGGYGLDAMWSDDFHHALHARLTGETGGYYVDYGDLNALAKTLRKGFALDGCHSSYRGRRHGRPLPTRWADGEADGTVNGPGRRLVWFVQNHDQIGNRPQGDRLSSSAGIERARLGAAFLLMAPATPLIFQGEEWAATSAFPYFTDHDEPGLARAVCRGRRRELAHFGWPRKPAMLSPQDAETFRRAQLHWREPASGDHAETLGFFRALIELRRNTPALRDGRFDLCSVSFDEQAGWLCLLRGPIGVWGNFSEQPLSRPIPAGFDLKLASSSGVKAEAGALQLPPVSAAVLIRKNACQPG